MSSSKVPLSNRRSHWLVVSLIMGVVGFGSANNVAGKIRSTPMGEYSFITGILNTFVYVAVWNAVFLYLRFVSKSISKEESSFIYSFRGRWKLLFLAGFGDLLGDTLGFIGQPYVSGVVFTLMSQPIIVFAAIFSMIILGTRYIAWEILGLVAVLTGVTLSVTHLEASHSSAGYALLVALSTSCNAFSFVIKEKIFREYNRKMTERSEDVDSSDLSSTTGLETRESTVKKDLNVFIVSSFTANAQLFWSIPTILMSPILAHSSQSLGDYLSNSAECFASTCEYAVSTYFVYVAFNLLFNLSLVLLVQYGSALLAFVSLKMITPISAFLFLIKWPLIPRESLTPLTFVELALVVCGVVFVRYGAMAREARQEKIGSTRVCLWPLFNRKVPNKEQESF